MMRRYLIIFLTALFIFPSLKIVQNVIDRNDMNALLEKSGFSEAKKHKANFRAVVETPRSITHIVSYLPTELLSEENFNQKAAEQVIDYVENIADEKSMYSFRPFVEKDTEINIKLVPRGDVPRENFVFIIPDEFPLPENFVDAGRAHPALADSINENRTFFWTMFLNDGSVSVIRYAGSDNWRRGLPKEGDKSLSPIQQINLGFNIEIWKRSVAITPLAANDQKEQNLPSYDNDLFFTSEVVWNTFGQLVALKQENIPVKFMIERIETQTLSRSNNLRYYPFDEKAQRLYEGAPTTPIISE